MLAAPVTDFERLDFASADPAALVRDILADAAGAFDRTRALRARIADDLSEGRTAEALASLTDCFTVWSRTHETLIKSAALLGVDLNAVDLDGRSGRDRLQNVADALRQLRDALDAGDHVLLADILRYELDATMDDWQRLISALSSHADSAHSSAGRRH